MPGLTEQDWKRLRERERVAREAMMGAPSGRRLVVRAPALPQDVPAKEASADKS